MTVVYSKNSFPAEEECFSSKLIPLLMCVVDSVLFHKLPSREQLMGKAAKDVDQSALALTFVTKILGVG